jgi:cobalt-zinc-cadmium efflux system outer membrane protein
VRRVSTWVFAPLVVAALIGCAGPHESTLRRDLARARVAYASSATVEDGRSPPLAKGGLSAYLRLALNKNPELRASFERWRASVHRISSARRLPEPTLGFGYFVRSVETRVGPQQARISLQQAFPWPTRLTAGADAASARARSMQRRFEAQALSVAQRVEVAYWNLWQLRTTRRIHREHLDVIRGLSEVVRARVSASAASLADLQQIDLTAARIADNIRGMDEAERGAEALLRAAIGVPPAAPVPTPDEPGRVVMPSDAAESLAASVRAHPMIDSVGFLAEASEAQARAEGADRLPSFTVGADWIVTGEAAAPDVPGSGRDAVIVGAGIRVPLWQGSYGDSVEAAEAESRAQRAEQRSLVDRAESELTVTLANLRDAQRRVELYRVTLVPQAQSAFESVLGTYTVGRGTVAQTLLSQRDLLELRIELERARADHARSWSRLEGLTGRELIPDAETSRPPGAER